MQANDTSRIDEHVATQLGHVGVGTLQTPTTQRQFQVDPPGRESPKVLPAGTIHAVGTIEFEVRVGQNRPGKPRLFDVRIDDPARLEGDYDNAHLTGLQLRCVLTQLRQMLTAGQSPQVAVKDQ